MATDYQRLLGLRSLNGKVEAFGKDVTRTGVFRQKFQSYGRKLVAEDGTFEWDEVTYGRGLAPVTGHAAPFPEGNPLGTVHRKSSVVHIKRMRRLDPYRMHYEREPGTLRPNAAAYVEREMKEAMNEIMATHEYLSAESLRGTVTVNPTNIPGSTQSFTITYSPNTYTASNSWATAATKIISVELNQLKADVEQTCGLSPAQVIGGAAVNGYITGNSEITNYAAPLMGQRFIEQGSVREGPMLGGLLVGGLTWTITEGGYVPEGGAFTRYLPTVDEAIVLPPDGELSEVIGWVEGRGMIPAQQYGPASAAADLCAPAPQQGWYAFAMLDGNGPAILLCVGYVGNPVVLRPAAVCVANLIP